MPFKIEYKSWKRNESCTAHVKVYGETGAFSLSAELKKIILSRRNSHHGNHIAVYFHVRADVNKMANDIENKAE